MPFSFQPRQVKLGHINQPRQMSETERAYWAGIVDGEGSICVAKAVFPEWKQKQPQYRLVLSVANTSFELLEACLRMVGIGNISRVHKNNEKWKDGGQLILNSEAAAFCIDQIRPYLVIKKEQADIAMRFIQLKRDWSRKNDTRPEQAEIYMQMKALNARGKANQKDYQFEVRDKPQRTCSYDGCEAVHYGNGYCRRHYRWIYESKSWSEQTTRKCQGCDGTLASSLPLTAKFCSVACKMKYHRAKGCYTEAALADAPKCEREGCDRPRQAKGLCRRHYMQEWHKTHPA